MKRPAEILLPNPTALAPFREELLSWFQNHGRPFPWRSQNTSTYEYIIAEVLLQRTRAETISSIFADFVETYPSWESLSESSTESLENSLRPIGLWRRRSTSIRALANEMCLRKGVFPSQRAEIESLPGIGQYIANAVLLFCHNDPQPLLDVNMARVLERVFGPRHLADIRYDPYLQQLAANVVRCDNAIQINWSILDLAALTCLPRRPRCGACPVASMCLSRVES